VRPSPEERLEVLAAAQDPVVLAGPGVVTARAVPALHAFATAGWLGVLNTWGAKGIFPWQSVHHWATVGLQRDDFALGGLPAADLIVGVGLDPAESPDERWQLAPHLMLEPAELGGIAQLWERKRPALRMPPLRDRLAAATQAGWQVGTAPLPPSRVTQAYGAVAAAGGLVAADPGPAGFWVARTVATTLLDSVIVPSTAVGPGFAIACALVARIARPARPVLAVLDGGLTGQGEELHGLAQTLGLPVPVEIWTSEGDRLDARAHAERLGEAVFGEGSAVLPLVTDAEPWLARMVEAAGPVVAWPGV
jgi:acetolactate synthase-1/2/3 large subunit